MTSSSGYEWMRVLSCTISNILKMRYWWTGKQACDKYNTVHSQNSHPGAAAVARSQLDPAIAVTQQLPGILRQFVYPCEECFYMCTFLPYRSRFQNQDCGAEREEDQTPDLVSGRRVSGSCLWEQGAINVSSCLYYQISKNRMAHASLPPSIGNCYTLVMVKNL